MGVGCQCGYRAHETLSTPVCGEVAYASGSGSSSSSSKPSVQELYNTFKEAFPECRENLDFFLGHMANRFGEGGKVWEENRHEDVGGRTLEELNGYWFG